MSEQPNLQSSLLQKQDKRRLRKLTEVSLLIPFLGVIMFVSPLIDAFTTINGSVPSTSPSAIVKYVFGVWISMILAALIISRLFVSTDRDG